MSTVHGVETNGLIPLESPCMGNYFNFNAGSSSCGTMLVYVHLESQTKEAEMHFDNNDFNMSSPSEVEDYASKV